MESTTKSTERKHGICVPGMIERFIISLSNGALGMEPNEEYQQIAKAIENEPDNTTATGENQERTFSNEVLLHALSMCFNSNSERFEDATLTIDDKIQILIDCVMTWLRENKDYNSTVVPANLRQLVEESRDLLMNGGRRKRRTKRRRNKKTRRRKYKKSHRRK